MIYSAIVCVSWIWASFHAISCQVLIRKNRVKLNSSNSCSQTITWQKFVFATNLEVTFIQIKSQLTPKSYEWKCIVCLYVIFVFLTNRFIINASGVLFQLHIYHQKILWINILWTVTGKLFTKRLIILNHNWKWYYYTETTYFTSNLK